jgi:hypothetical protein
MPGSSFSGALTMIVCRRGSSKPLPRSVQRQERPSCRSYFRRAKTLQVAVDRFDLALQRVELLLAFRVERFALRESFVHDGLLPGGLARRENSRTPRCVQRSSCARFLSV